MVTWDLAWLITIPVCAALNMPACPVGRLDFIFDDFPEFKLYVLKEKFLLPTIP